MSFPDPYGDEREIARRARHAGAAPDSYPPPPSTEPGVTYPAAGVETFDADPGGAAYPLAAGVGADALPVPEPAALPVPEPAPLDSATTHGWPLTDPAPPPAPRRRGGHRRARARGGNGQRRPSRAGRNLPAAIGVGVALVLVILVSIFVWPPAFLGVLGGAVLVGTWELARAVRAGGARPPLPPLLAGGLLMVGMAWWAGPEALALGLVVTVLAALVWRLADGPEGYQRDIGAAALIAVYVPFLAAFAALLVNEPHGDLRVLVTLAAVVLSDTGGYAAGVFFGKHPMAPSVSPKKSWEGLVGSLLATGVGSALLLYPLLDVAPWWGLLFGLGVSTAAVLGDLGESMIKRDLGVKDMSNLLPGHGGLMDRLDSILFALPTSYLLLTLFVPGG